MNAPSSYVVFADGGSRGNPGPAAYGYVVFHPDGRVVAEKSCYLGVLTNNQAEYRGIVAALEELANLEVNQPVICKLDSELVVRQITGVYKTKNAALRPWLDRIRIAVRSLGVAVQFVHVPRRDNRYADKLVNDALDGQERIAGD